MKQRDQPSAGSTSKSKSKDVMDSDTEGDQEYPCPLCEVLLSSKKQLKTHWKDSHNSYVRPTDEAEESDPLSKNTESSTQADSIRMDDSAAGASQTGKTSDLCVDDSSGSPSASLLESAQAIRMYLCSLCNTSFRTTQSLSLHWSDKHNWLFHNQIEENMEMQPGVDKYKCKLCQTSFCSELDIGVHMKADHEMEKPFKCALCDKPFTTKKKIRTHLSCHFPNSLFRCSECSNTFKTHKELQTHDCWLHYVRERLEEDKNKAASPGENHNDSAEFQDKRLLNCSLCQEKFTSTRPLSRHWEQTHDRYFEKLEETRPEPLTNLPKQTLNYQCEWCGMEFRRRRYFNTHRSKHLSHKSYRCCICQQTFNEKHKVRMHLRFHLSKRPHVCSVCGKSFMTAKHLRSHTRGIHGPPEEKRRFVCELCGKGFPFRHSLKRHMEANHLPQADRPRAHKCDVCGKGFFVRSRLLYHKTTHLDYAPHLCNMCGKAFKCRVNLRIHQRNHNESSRHPCSICHKNFSHKIIRTAHRLIEHHKGCTECGLALFTKKDALMHRHVCGGFAKVNADEDEATKKAAISVHTQVRTGEEVLVSPDGNVIGNADAEVASDDADAIVRAVQSVSVQPAS